MEVRFQSYRDESRRTRPAIPIVSDRPVLFDGAEYRLWAYSAAKGLILEVIQKIDKREFLKFYRKWEHADEESLDWETRERIEREHPIRDDLRISVKVNGRKAPGWNACRISWFPEGLVPYEGSQEAKELVQGYQLDENEVWGFTRFRVEWPFSRRPVLRSLSVTLEKDRGQVPCGPVVAARPGCDPFDVQLDGGSILHILSCTAQEFDPDSSPHDPGWIYPTHYLALEYREDPLPDPSDRVVLRDRSNGDPVRRTPDAEKDICSPVVSGAVGIILMGEKGSDSQFAASSVYSEAPDQVEWIPCRGEPPVPPLELVIL